MVVCRGCGCKVVRSSVAGGVVVVLARHSLLSFPDDRVATAEQDCWLRSGVSDAGHGCSGEIKSLLVRTKAATATSSVGSFRALSGPDRISDPLPTTVTQRAQHSASFMSVRQVLPPYIIRSLPTAHSQLKLNERTATSTHGSTVDTTPAPTLLSLLRAASQYLPT